MLLSRASLSGADLNGPDLSRAYLGGANLTEANLRGADLSGAGGIDDAQLAQACGDDTIKLPEGMTIRRCE